MTALDRLVQAAAKRGITRVQVTCVGPFNALQDQLRWRVEVQRALTTFTLAELDVYLYNPAEELLCTEALRVLELMERMP